MKLKRCSRCGRYGLKEVCSGCSGEMRDAHYKFVNVRDVVKRSK